MDVENDLEEQLTSYHICKLPTDSTQNEIATTIGNYSPRSYKGTSKNINNYRLEVYTVETQATASSNESQEPEHPLQELQIESAIGASSKEQNPTASKTRRRKEPEKKSSKDYMKISKVISGDTNVGELTSNKGTPENSRMWYQLPQLQEKSPPTGSTQSPAALPVRKSLAQAPAVNQTAEIPLSQQQIAVINSQNTTILASQIAKQSPVKRKTRQNTVTTTSPPVAYIKIEDDEDDVCLVNNSSMASFPVCVPQQNEVVTLTPAPAPLPPSQQQSSPQVRHVIKLVTSVPVSRYPCEFCGAVFELWNQRENHIETKHKINDLFTCFICEKAAQAFYIKEESIYKTFHYHYLQAHLAESHKITGQPRGFQCPYCSIPPASYTSLVRHLTFDHDTSETLMNTYVLVNVLEDRLEG